jgi:hypothetical protein
LKIYNLAGVRDALAKACPWKLENMKLVQRVNKVNVGERYKDVTFTTYLMKAKSW